MHMNSTATIRSGLTSYTDLNQLVSERYGEQRQVFPHAFSFLEKELRLFLTAGHQVFFAKNVEAYCSELDRHGYIRKRLTHMLVGLSGRFCGSRRRIYMDLPRFPLIADAVAGHARMNGLTVSSPILGAKQVTEYFPASKIALSGREIAVAFRAMRDYCVDEVMRNHELLRKLDRRIAYNKEILQKHIVRRGIRCFVCQDDSKPAHRILSLAARGVDVPYIVVAHGYFQCPFLISIAPVTASALVVWSEAQIRYLNDLAPDIKERGLAITFGFPFSRPETNHREKLVLVALSLVRMGVPVEEERAFLNDLCDVIQRASDDGFRVVVRRHPKEAGDRVLGEQLQKLGAEVSDLTLAEDIARAAIVLGSNSSVLVEAAFSGSAAFQLTKYKSFQFEGVHPYPYQGLTSFSALLRQVPRCNAIPDFDQKRFLDFLDGLILSAPNANIPSA